MTRRKKQKRWEGSISITDRVAFYMPGEHYITAGEVLDVSLDQQTLTIGNIAGMEGTALRRKTTVETVGSALGLGKPARGGTALTMKIQRGLVVENKTEVRREQYRNKKKGKGKRHVDE